MVKPDPVHDVHWYLFGRFISRMIYDALVEHALELGISVEAWTDSGFGSWAMVICEDYNAPY